MGICGSSESGGSGSAQTTTAPALAGLFKTQREEADAQAGALGRSMTMKAREESKGLYVYEPTADIADFYTMKDQIGQPGQFGVARIAICKGNGAKYVVKIIKKARFQRAKPEKRIKVFEDMRSEIEILRKVKHDLIIKLYDVFEDKANLYLVTELCSGGELFDAISSKGTYSEREAAGVVGQIFKALAHLHEKGIAHCDLKPDNFLFKDKSQKHLKVIDFGMAKRVTRRDKLEKLVGTPYYTAPEVIEHNYHTGADVWSIGVVMFVMLFGYPPFYVDPQKFPGKKEGKAIYKLIEKGFEPIVMDGYGAFFPKKIKVSDEARDLITLCLTKSLDTRLTALEALDHPWFKMASDAKLAHFNKGIPELHIKSFHNFRTKNEFQQAAYAIFAEKFSVMKPDQKASVQDTFKTLDVDGDGSVTVEEFTSQLGKTDLFKGDNNKQLTELFHALDIDGDGTLNIKELMTSVVGNMVQARKERLWEQFQKFDTDSSGEISRDELKEALTGMPPGLLGNADVDDLIRQADRNGDGQISWEEFLDCLDPDGKSLEIM